MTWLSRVACEPWSKWVLNIVHVPWAGKPPMYIWPLNMYRGIYYQTSNKKWVKLNVPGLYRSYLADSVNAFETLEHVLNYFLWVFITCFALFTWTGAKCILSISFLPIYNRNVKRVHKLSGTKLITPWIQLFITKLQAIKRDKRFNVTVHNGFVRMVHILWHIYLCWICN